MSSMAAEVDRACGRFNGLLSGVVGCHCAGRDRPGEEEERLGLRGETSRERGRGVVVVFFFFWGGGCRCGSSFFCFLFWGGSETRGRLPAHDKKGRGFFFCFGGGGVGNKGAAPKA